METIFLWIIHIIILGNFFVGINFFSNDKRLNKKVFNIIFLIMSAVLVIGCFSSYIFFKYYYYDVYISNFQVHLKWAEVYDKLPFSTRFFRKLFLFFGNSVSFFILHSFLCFICFVIINKNRILSILIGGVIIFLMLKSYSFINFLIEYVY